MLYLSPNKQKTAKYVLTIKLSEETPLTNWRDIKNGIDKISNDQYKTFFTSSDGRCAGFFVVCNLTAGGLHACLNGDTSIIQLSTLRRGDSLFVSEIDDKNWMATGFSSGWSWLQHQ